MLTSHEMSDDRQPDFFLALLSFVAGVVFVAWLFKGWYWWREYRAMSTSGTRSPTTQRGGRRCGHAEDRLLASRR